MNHKEQIIEWLVSNEAQAIEIIEKTKPVIDQVPKEFADEATRQINSEIQRQLNDEICKAVGIPSDMIYEIMDDDRIDSYIKYIEQQSRLAKLTK